MSKGKRRIIIVLIAMATLAVLWLAGPVGWLLWHAGIPRFLPYRYHTRQADIILESISSDTLPPPAPENGALIMISPRRLRAIMFHAEPLSILLPGGLIKNGTRINATVTSPYGTNDIVFVLNADTVRPKLMVKIPLSEFRAIVNGVFAEKLSRRKRWSLGHYNIEYKPVFETFHIYTADNDKLTPSRERLARGIATGYCTVWFRDNLLSVRSTGKVDKLELNAVLHIRHVKGGVSLSYDVRVTSFKADFHNIPKMLDKKIVKALRKSMERSFNKSKKKKRFEKHVLPEWLPYDLAIDLDLIRDVAPEKK